MLFKIETTGEKETVAYFYMEKPAKEHFDWLSKNDKLSVRMWSLVAEKACQILSP